MLGSGRVSLGMKCQGQDMNHGLHFRCGAKGDMAQAERWERASASTKEWLGDLPKEAGFCGRMVAANAGKGS